MFGLPIPTVPTSLGAGADRITAIMERRRKIDEDLALKKQQEEAARSLQNDLTEAISKGKKYTADDALLGLPEAEREKNRAFAEANPDAFAWGGKLYANWDDADRGHKENIKRGMIEKAAQGKGYKLTEIDKEFQNAMAEAARLREQAQLDFGADNEEAIQKVYSDKAAAAKAKYDEAIALANALPGGKDTLAKLKNEIRLANRNADLAKGERSRLAERYYETHRGLSDEVQGYLEEAYASNPLPQRPSANAGQRNISRALQEVYPSILKYGSLIPTQVTQAESLINKMTTQGDAATKAETDLYKADQQEKLRLLGQFRRAAAAAQDRAAALRLKRDELDRKKQKDLWDHIDRQMQEEERNWRANLNSITTLQSSDTNALGRVVGGGMAGQYFLHDKGIETMGKVLRPFATAEAQMEAQREDAQGARKRLHGSGKIVTRKSMIPEAKRGEDSWGGLRQGEMKLEDGLYDPEYIDSPAEQQQNDSPAAGPAKGKSKRKVTKEGKVGTLSQADIEAMSKAARELARKRRGGL